MVEDAGGGVDKVTARFSEQDRSERAVSHRRSKRSISISIIIIIDISICSIIFEPLKHIHTEMIQFIRAGVSKVSNFPHLTKEPPPIHPNS